MAALRPEVFRQVISSRGNSTATHTQHRALLLSVPVQSGGQPPHLHPREQIFYWGDREAVQRETGIIRNVNNGGVDLAFPQETGQLDAVF